MVLAMTLDQLKPGERGVVTGWTASEPPTRLLEMGLLQGTQLEILRLAPLGDPIDIRIRGYRLSLRKHEAGLVQIQPL
jgi:ferrous iron transport protein A